MSLFLFAKLILPYRAMEQTVRPYSDYESGKIRISVEGMLILAKFYNASMDYILSLIHI